MPYVYDDIYEITVSISSEYRTILRRLPGEFHCVQFMFYQTYFKHV